MAIDIQGAARFQWANSYCNSKITFFPKQCLWIQDNWRLSKLDKHVIHDNLWGWPGQEMWQTNKMAVPKYREVLSGFQVDSMLKVLEDVSLLIQGVAE